MSRQSRTQPSDTNALRSISIAFFPEISQLEHVLGLEPTDAPVWDGVLSLASKRIEAKDDWPRRPGHGDVSNARDALLIEDELGLGAQTNELLQRSYRSESPDRDTRLNLG
jgi:hypothetical protein